MLEIRGVFYVLLHRVFPGIKDLVNPELAGRLPDAEPEEWYDGRPYVECVRVLKTVVSPEVLALMGNTLGDAVRPFMEPLAIKTPAELARRAGELFALMVRGDEAGRWFVEDYTPGRAVVVSDSLSRDAFISAGLVKGALEAVGAYNVRTTVLADVADGSSENRILAEWLEPAADGLG